MAHLRSLIIGAATCVLLASSTVESVAQSVPRQMSYQGILREGDRLLQDGSYTVTFSLYYSISDKTAFWHETRQVNVSGGLFNVLLGEHTPLPDLKGKVFVGMKIGNSDEFSRMQLSSVPFALNAATAQALSHDAKGAVLSLNGQQGNIDVRGDDGLEIRTDNGALVVGLSQQKKEEGILNQGTEWLLAGNTNTTSTSWLGTSNNFPLIVKTNNTERFRVLSTGNMGIGETNPASRLTVARTLHLTNTGGAPELKLSAASGANVTTFKTGSQSSNITYTLPSDDGSNGDVLSTDGTGELSWIEGGWGTIGNSNITSNKFLGTTNAQPLIVKTNNVERIRLTSSGALGINEDNPSQKLDIAGYVLIKQDGAGTGELRLQEPTGNTGSNYTAIRSGNMPSNITYTLPSTAPSSGQVLSSNSQGVMTWVDASASGTAGGDLNGTYPNPTIAQKGATSGQVLKWNSTEWAPSDEFTLTHFTENRNVTSPNNTVPSHQFVVNGTETDIDVVLSPKGNGSVAAEIADNTNAGGNKRGTQAVDWQMTRSANTQVASGNYSAIGGGNANEASGNYSTVTGGQNNIASGLFSAVGGGYGNQSTTTATTINGGLSNYANGAYSSISGGSDNSINGDYAVIGGGRNNTVNGVIATISGGAFNAADSNATVAGGISNNASGAASTISGGRNNTVSGSTSVIVGGRGLLVSGNGTMGFLSNSDGANDMSVSQGNIALMGNIDVWLANNDNTAHQLRFYEANNSTGSFPPSGTNYTAFKAGTQTADITYTLPIAEPSSNGQILTSATDGTMSWTDDGLVNFSSIRNTSVPNATIPVHQIIANGSEDDIDMVLSPKGSGALSAQVADNTVIGGNKRGNYAIDWQLGRNLNSQVASGTVSTISGGISSESSGYGSTVGGGVFNKASMDYAVVDGGYGNVASGDNSTVGGGTNNTASAENSTIAGGSNNTVSGIASTILGGRGLNISGTGSMGFISNIVGTNNMTVSSHNTAVMGNVDVWLANNDNTARGLRFYEANNTTGSFPPSGTNYTAFKAGSQSADITYTLPTASPSDNGQILTSATDGTMSWANDGLVNFNSIRHTTAPNSTTPIHQLVVTGSETNIDLVISPKGSGSVSADVADNDSTGGNKRGLYAVDWQMNRADKLQVASSMYSTIGGGYGNKSNQLGATISGGILNSATGDHATVSGGINNIASGQYSNVGGGLDNSATNLFASVAGGNNNTASQPRAAIGGGVDNVGDGFATTISGGYANSATAAYTVISGGRENSAGGEGSAIIGGRGLSLSGSGAMGYLSNVSGSNSMTVAVNNTAVLGNVDIWLGNNDNTAHELRFYEANNTTGSFPPSGINYTAFKAGSQSADVTYTLPTAAPSANGQVLSGATDGTLSWADAGLANFTSNRNTTAPNTTQPVHQLIASGSDTHIDIALTPKGNGALTAQIADNAVTGGNKRGTKAVDWQLNRNTNTQVASGQYATIGGGYGNTASSNYSTVAGGEQNQATATQSSVGGGFFNRATAQRTTIVGGIDNVASGDYSTILGGRGLTLSGTSSVGYLSNSGGTNNMTVSANSTAVMGNTDVWLANNDNTAHELRFYEANNTTGTFPPAGTNYTAFKAGTQSANITYTLPVSAPASDGDVLTSTTGGTLSWTTPSSGGGGSTPAFAKRSSQVTVSTTSPTYTDILSVSLDANKTYKIECWLIGARELSTNAPATGRMFYTGTANTEYGMGLFFNGAMITGTSFNNSALFDTEAGGQGITFTTTNQAKIIYIGYITTTSAGTLTIQAARATTNTTDNFIVREGSYIIATPLN